jgi:putative transposase
VASLERNDTQIAMDARPGGPAAKRQPSPAGLGIDPMRPPSAVGTPPYVLFCAKPLSTRMSHSYSNNYVHVVYSTKDRKDLIPTKFEKRLYSFIASIAREHKIALIAAGGMPNHSHLLFLLPATISLASAINIFKTNSSRFLHERGLAFQWQNGYGAFSVSVSQIDEVIAYIRSQPDHHKKMTFEQEFLALLKKAGVPYDPKYVMG